MAVDFEIGNVYSFNTLAPAVLNVRIVRAKLNGIVDYKQACTIVNVDVIQRQVYPLLPPGTPNNTQKYIYYVFTTESGARLCLAKNWIQLSSVELVEDATITVTIPGATLDDVERLRVALGVMGFRGFTIDVS